MLPGCRASGSGCRDVFQCRHSALRHGVVRVTHTCSLFFFFFFGKENFQLESIALTLTTPFFTTSTFASAVLVGNDCK